MQKMSQSLRWAFRCSAWSPSREQWLAAAQCVQAEEKERIGQFVFKKDAKSSMSGRLMLRKAISENLYIQWKDIQIGRSNKGKPYLLNQVPGSAVLSVNVSHQGDFAVLAAETDFEVGIDVMKIQETAGQKSVGDFFDLMKRQFTEYEWMHIRQAGPDIHQLATFYRFWCLKESYVKALGVGISISLQNIEFHIKSGLRVGEYTCDTQMYVEGALQADWRFEETLLDQQHCVATALCKKSRDWDLNSPAFTVLSFEDMISNAQYLSDPDEQYWLNFSQKEEKPRGQR